RVGRIGGGGIGGAVEDDGGSTRRGAGRENWCRSGERAYQGRAAEHGCRHLAQTHLAPPRTKLTKGQRRYLGAEGHSSRRAPIPNCVSVRPHVDFWCMQSAKLIRTRGQSAHRALSSGFLPN